VLKKDGLKVKGVLVSYEPETSILIESEKIIKNEKNKKQTIKEQITIPLQEIKESSNDSMQCFVLYVCEPIREHALLTYGNERYWGYCSNYWRAPPVFRHHPKIHSRSW
jgi:small nuclear ribonucleoprotein (snRNP)-like protein